MTKASEVAPIPPGATPGMLNKLKQARSSAVDALLEAEELEAEARRARRQAASRMRHYTNLLREHDGQLRLDPFREEEPSRS